jgi:thiol-disulfide isomerase/thioredoxin
MFMRRFPLSAGLIAAFACQVAPATVTEQQRLQTVVALGAAYEALPVGTQHEPDKPSPPAPGDQPGTQIGEAVNYARRYLAIAAEEPADRAAFQALLGVLDLGSPPMRMQARQLLRAHHLAGRAASELIEHLLPIDNSLTETQDDIELLKAVMARNPDRRVRGAAWYAIGYRAAGVSFTGSDLTASQRLHARDTAAGAMRVFQKSYADVDFGTANVNRASREAGAMARDAQLIRFAMENLREGHAAPAGSGTRLDGRKAKLTDYRGNVLVVDMWASWCAACVEVIPAYQALYARYAGRGLRIVGQSQDFDANVLRRFLERKSIPWDTWYDGPRGGLFATWWVAALPTSYVIDRKGMIRAVNPGVEDLDALIAALIKEKG